jgi:hypothetical protein
VSDFAVLVEFDSEHPEFARGFEVGRLWTLLRERPHEVVEEHAHGANAEMLMRLGEATARQVRSEELGEGWLLVTFDPTQVFS